MATRRFCDICDKLLDSFDDQPLVRELSYIPVGHEAPPEGQPKPKIVAYVAITNEENHPLTDICIGCRLKVVEDGEAPAAKPTIATLQPRVPADTPVTTPLFRLPPEPPKVPMKPILPEPTPIQFEPSLPSRRPPEQQQ